MAQARVVLVVVVAALVACGNRAPRPPSLEDPENQAKMAKLAGYIECLERHTEHVFALGDAVRANAKTVSQTPDPETCLEAITEARGKLPAMPDVDTTAAAFAKSLQAVHELSKVGEKQLDDTTRTKLLDAVTEFDRTQGEFFDVTRVSNRQIHLDQLARRELKDGRTVSLRLEGVLVYIEGFVGMTSTPWDRLDALDIAGLTKELAALEGLILDLSARAQAEPTEVNEFAGYWSFEHHLRAFAVLVRQLIVRARDRVPYTDTEKLMIAANNEAEVVGTPASVMAGYNMLVDLYGVR